MRTRKPAATPRLVADLRASEAAQKELRWFFERALSEIEEPSNYGKMVERMIHGRRRLPRATRAFDTGAERRVEALHAARIIFERLDELRCYDRWVIRMLYEPAEWPRELDTAWGWLTPLVCALPSMADQFDDARSRGRTRATSVKAWLVEMVGLFGAELLAPLADEAQAAAATALAAYERTRGEASGSVVPDADEEVGR
jgi:hypothetical protein